MKLIDVLDRPIAFQRAFVSLDAGITGALMLSQAVYWSKRTDAEGGWFYKTMEEWEAETGLTRSEQEGARKKLVKAGVLEEQRKGVPCRLFFRVSFDALAANLGAEKPKTSKRKSRNPVCGKPANKDAENQQTGLQESSTQGCGKPANITENTAETTTEITAESSTPQAAAKAATGEIIPFTPQQPRCAIPEDMPGPKDPECKTYKTWANYAMAYRKRHGAWPVWNAKVGGQVGQLVARLGADVAHHVAAYFLNINEAKVVTNMHSIGDLLAKAETYHTQWLTNRQMTGTAARQIEQTQTNISAAEQALEALRAKRAATNAQ